MVKTNLEKGLLDISEQDQNLELHQSDLKDEFDPTVLVRGRARGSKSERAFSKKTGKVIQDTVTIFPERLKR